MPQWKVRTFYDLAKVMATGAVANEWGKKPQRHDVWKLPPRSTISRNSWRQKDNAAMEGVDVLL